MAGRRFRAQRPRSRRANAGVFERDEARRVLTVRERDDRLPPDLARCLRANGFELAQCRIQRVEQRRRAARLGSPDGLLERHFVVREGLENLGLAVEVDNLGDVLGREAARKAGRRFLRDGELAVHAGAAVEQDRQRDRQRIFREVGHGLEDAVLVDLEVLLHESGDEVAGAVGDGDVQQDEIRAALEHLSRGHRPREGGGARDGDERAANGHLLLTQRGAMTRTSFRFTSTSSLLGGIKESGRP
jgi:hypothetical protein